MPRKIFVVDPNCPYHITARCINKEWFSMPLEEVWDIMQMHLYFLARGHDIKIHSFVLMKNHFHLIASSPEANLSKAMAYFMKMTSDAIRKPSRRINRTYGARFHRTRIDSYNYYMCAYKYLYYNPVKANLCHRVEDYRFSTIRGLLGYEHMLVPVIEDQLLQSNQLESTLSWLNKKPNQDHYLLVKRALRKSAFHYPLNNRRANIFEKDVL